MKSITIVSFSIAFKIWLVAVLFNTVIDSFILNESANDYLFISVLILVFGGAFSFPVFLLLWVILYNRLKAGQSAVIILRILLIIATVLGLAVWLLFMATVGSVSSRFNEIIKYVAPLSGILAIACNYPAIKRFCQRRDEDKIMIESLGKDVATN